MGDPLTASLTQRMAKGEEAAYREFYDLYFERLFRYLLALTRGDEHAAREALQKTLLRVTRHAKRFDSEAVFWSWLAVLARSTVIDEHRSRHRHLSLLERFWRERKPEPAPDLEAGSQVSAILEASLTRLSDEERHLVELRYFRRLSIKEISASLNSTEKAVESRLVRIRRTLKSLVMGALKDETKV